MAGSRKGAGGMGRPAVVLMMFFGVAMSAVLTTSPSLTPTLLPSLSPTSPPTLFPTRNPTASATSSPTAPPSTSPTSAPTSAPTNPAPVRWNSSEVTLTEAGDGGANLQIVVTSNREVFRNSDGHFRVHVNATLLRLGSFEGISECVQVGAAESSLLHTLQALHIRFANSSLVGSLGDYLRISLKRYGDGKIQSGFRTTYDIVFSATSMTAIVSSVSVAGCAPLETVALWSDSRNWEGGVVPQSTHSVFLPADAGYIKLTEDVEVSSIEMMGGLILADNSPCPPGWSLGSSKNRLGSVCCLTLFSVSLSYL